MASGAFGTSVETMQGAASHVAEVNESVQGQLSALQNQLAPLAGAWTGSAATAFQTLMVRWDEDARSLNEALRAIGDSIAVSATDYDTTDEDQRQAFGGIGNVLG